MAQLLTLAPPVALLVGALFGADLPWRAWRPSWRVSLVATLVALGASLALVAIVWQAGPEMSSLRLTLSDWSFAAFVESPGLDVDLTASLCLSMISFGAVLAALRAQSADDRGALVGPLLVSAAAALFVAAAHAPLGLVMGWLALDLALLVGAAGGRAGLLAGQLGLLLALAGLVGVPLPYSASSGSYVGLTAVSEAGRFFLLGAAAIRMGVFPVWWALPRTDAERPWRACGTRLAPTVAGAYLLLRLAEQTTLGQGLSWTAMVPVLVALGGGAALAWLAVHRTDSLDWQTTHHAALVLMAATVGGSVGRALAIVILLDLVLVRGGLYATEGLKLPRAGRYGLWLLVAAAAGLPPTLGFGGRWLLYRELVEGDLLGVMVLAAASTVLATSALWLTVRVRPPARRYDRLLPVVVIALAATELVLGLRLSLLDRGFLRLTSLVLPVPLEQVLRDLTDRATVVDGLVVLAAILVPPVMAVAGGGVLRPMGDSRRRALRQALTLTTLVEGAAALVVRSGNLLHRGTGLLESRRSLAWTLMAVSVTGVAILVADAVKSELSTPPTVIAVALFAAACALAALMLLSRSPAVTLAALGAGYVLSVTVLFAVGSPIVVVLINLLVGALVVGILAISVAQIPVDRHLTDTARRLRALGAPDAKTSSRLLPAIALGVGFLISYGLQPSVAPDALPAALLHPALALVAGGVLTAVFARSPLRLAAGVLLALAGAELVSAGLDPGLLITGGLAVFQLLFAVVASYYVGAVASTYVDS